MIRRAFAAVSRYVPGSALVALLVWSTGPMRRWGLPYDPTALIILTMIGTAWYLGRGPGLLVALLFEAAMDYYGTAPKNGFIIFNRILLFTSVVLFASAR